MEKQYQVVEEKGANQRLDKALCLLFDISRNRAKELIDEEAVLVNGIGTKPSYKVQTGDEIELLMPPLEEIEIKPENIPLDIVYEDEDVLVVNKPRGMVVHPSPGHYSGTLVNALMYHIKDLSGINGVLRPGIVHRIDKDTSGLLIVCKNDNAHTQISKQLSEKECKREYKAIVHHPFSHTFGTIDAPIGRDEKNRQKMAVTANNSKNAVTHFEVLENFKNYAYILCKLETGRTHQIRVHMEYIEHPIVGDPKYGYRKTLPTDGQLLHAYALEFTHPTTGKRMRFEKEPPQIFQDVLHKMETGEIE